MSRPEIHLEKYRDITSRNVYFYAHFPSACDLPLEAEASTRHATVRRAVKEKQKSEAAVAGLRGQGDAEMEALRSEAAAAGHRSAEAQSATERVESELREYKVCDSKGHRY